MRKGDSNNSILYLKHKFDEIRKNITSIEQRQKEFYVNSKPSDTSDLIKSISFREYTPENPSKDHLHSQHTHRPSSVGRLKDNKTEINREILPSNYIEIIKKLEMEKQDLLLKLSKITLLKDELIKENMQLKSNRSNQMLEIEHLREENERLRRELNSKDKDKVGNSSLSFRESRFDTSPDQVYSTHSNSSPSPKPSIIKSENSSPKKNRVAFSRDLVQVKHISNDDYKSHKPKLRSTSPIGSSVAGLSPQRIYSNKLTTQDTQPTQHKQERPNSSLGFTREAPPDDNLHRSEWKVTRPYVSGMPSFEKRINY